MAGEPWLDYQIATPAVAPSGMKGPWEDYGGPPVAPPAASEGPGLGTKILQQAEEFGKGVVGAPPQMVGQAIQGAAVGARGFARQQIEAMDAIDKNLPYREADDPMGYKYMLPEERDAARSQIEASIAAPIQETSTYKTGKQIETSLDKALAPRAGVTPGLARDIGGGIGSTATGVAMGLIPGVGVPLAGATFTLAGTGQAVQDAIKAGASQEQIERAGRLGTVAGATDLVDALLPQLGSVGKIAGLVKRVGVRALESGVF